MRRPPPQNLERETANASLSTQHSVPASHSTSTHQYYPASVSTQYCPALSCCSVPAPNCSLYIICLPPSVWAHVSTAVADVSCIYTDKAFSFFLFFHPCILMRGSCFALHVCRAWCHCCCMWLKMHRFVSWTLENFYFWAGRVGRAGGYSGQTCRCLDPATLTSWGSSNYTEITCKERCKTLPLLREHEGTLRAWAGQASSAVEHVCTTHISPHYEFHTCVQRRGSMALGFLL